MIKKISSFLLVILFLISFSFATDYYVKNGGNDGASGLDDDNAWETISKVNTGPGPGYNAGDNVYFKKNNTWRITTLTPPSSGGLGNLITFGSYGSGANPIIYGSDLMTTWIIEAGNVWKKTGVTTQPKVLIPGGTWGVYEAVLGNLNANNEWHWAADVLYVYTDGGDPDTQWPSGIEAGQRDYGVNINWVNYIGIDSIDIKYSSFHGITINTSTGSEITNCNTTMTGGLGYNLFNGDSCLIDSCTQNGGKGGIDAHDGSDGNTFQYNHFQNSITTTQGNGVGGFIIEDSDSNVARYNLIHTAYFADPTRNGDGFVIRNADSNEIYYNIIYEMNDGIDIDGGDNNEYYNNISYKIRYTHWTLCAAATGNLLKNNIFYESVVNNFFADGNQPAQGNTIDYNCYYDPDISAGGADCITWNIAGLEVWGSMNFDAWVAHAVYDQNSFFGNPLLITPGTNFHLQVGSPCRNTGTNVGLSEDYDGVAVPQETNPAIGAYEYLMGAILRIREILRIRNVLRIK